MLAPCSTCPLDPPRPTGRPWSRWTAGRGAARHRTTKYPRRPGIGAAHPHRHPRCRGHRHERVHHRRVDRSGHPAPCHPTGGELARPPSDARRPPVPRRQRSRPAAVTRCRVFGRPHRGQYRRPTPAGHHRQQRRTPLLLTQPGGGGEGTHDQTYWLSPVPPDGGRPRCQSAIRTFRAVMYQQLTRPGFTLSTGPVVDAWRGSDADAVTGGPAPGGVEVVGGSVS